ncbi:hypothetical protein BDW60DRAFT_192174 [Aspergillus nidulans var. acristatus]
MTSLLSYHRGGPLWTSPSKLQLPILQEESGGGPWIPRIESTRAPQWDLEMCQPTVRLTVFVQEDNARSSRPRESPDAIGWIPSHRVNPASCDLTPDFLAAEPRVWELSSRSGYSLKQ